MRRSLFRATAALLLAGGIVGGLASPAWAAKPVKHACVGETFAFAAALPGTLGSTVRSFAQAPDDRPGLGDGIQAVQAGLVPDAVAINTCN